MCSGCYSADRRSGFAHGRCQNMDCSRFAGRGDFRRAFVAYRYFILDRAADYPPSTGGTTEKCAARGDVSALGSYSTHASKCSCSALGQSCYCPLRCGSRVDHVWFDEFQEGKLKPRFAIALRFHDGAAKTLADCGRPALLKEVTQDPFGYTARLIGALCFDRDVIDGFNAPRQIPA